MAIHLPSNLYSEGQVPLNSNAFTQYYLQEKSKQRARKDAFDAYYRDLGKGLSPAGMAADESADFMKKIQGWKNYTIQNRAILNDPKHPDYAAKVTESQYLYNDALEQAEASKSKVKDLYQGRQLIKPDHPLTDATMQMFGAASAPISQGYQPMDFSQVEYDEKPYDYLAQQKDIDAALKGVQLGKTVTKIQSDPKTHSNTVTYDFEYNPQALKDIAQRGAVAYQTNNKVKKWLDNQVVDKQQFDALNPTFKEAYGKDIQSGEDKYTAMLLLNAKQPYEQQAVQHFNQFEGQYHGGAAGKPNPPELWSRSVVEAGNQAAQTGDITQLRNVASQLFSGNGARRLGNKADDVKYEVVNGRPAVKLTTYPITDARDKEYDIKAQAVKDGKMPKSALNIDGLTSTFYLDEGTPQLLSKLVGVYQQAMGSDASSEKTQNYNQPATDVPKTQPKKSTKKDNDPLGIR